MKTQQAELFDTNRTIALKLTSGQAYSRKQRLWKAYLQWACQIRRAFFPDTGGSGHLMHNWHKCGHDVSNAKLAEWIDDSTYARYKAIESKLEARSAMREHLTHGANFIPLWCPLCNPR